jgi:hypothetical protein
MVASWFGGAEIGVAKATGYWLLVDLDHEEIHQ